MKSSAPSATGPSAAEVEPGVLKLPEHLLHRRLVRHGRILQVPLVGELGQLVRSAQLHQLREQVEKAHAYLGVDAREPVLGLVDEPDQRLRLLVVLHAGLEECEATKDTGLGAGGSFSASPHAWRSARAASTIARRANWIRASQ